MGSWKIPNRIEREYARALNALARQVGAALGNDPDPYAAVRRLRQIAQHPPWREFCDALALKMTTHTQTRINGTWRTAAQRAGRGSDIYMAIEKELSNNGIYDAFINQVRENAALIKSFPIGEAEELTGYIQSETMKGRRASDIAGELRKFFDDRSQAKMNLIARTETSKTQTALTRARAERLNLPWYVWRTSDDSRVRSSHDHMDGVLIRWDDPPRPEALVGEEKPPPPYHAGNIYNCRCYPEPVVDIGFLTFPMRVYHDGRIQKMTRSHFERVA